MANLWRPRFREAVSWPQGETPAALRTQAFTCQLWLCLTPERPLSLSVPQSHYLQNGADNPCPAPNKMLVKGNALKTSKLLLLSREGATSPTQISSDRPAFHSVEEQF